MSSLGSLREPVSIFCSNSCSNGRFCSSNRHSLVASSVQRPRFVLRQDQAQQAGRHYIQTRLFPSPSVPEFEKAAFSSPLNKIIRVKTKFGWHLVQALSERFLGEAFSNDREIQEIFENAFEAPEEMGKRVNERFKRKEKDILQTKTGTSVPMKVSFCEFDATDSYIWMELYSSPSKKDIDLIGSAIRAWYVLGCLGGYNSLNIQLTKIPVNERLRYKEYVEDDLVPARFVNVGELEFQHNLGRFWVDLGSSDPLSLDVLVNTFTSISSDYVAIKELIFGGKQAGRWKEEITLEEEGHLSFKI